MALIEKVHCPKFNSNLNNIEIDHSTLSIIQFNCLADALSDAFPHVSSPHILTWEHRRPLFEIILKQLSCDFLCLEEVDHFDDFFMPFMASLGYSGVFQKRRHEPSPISHDGVALFWRKERFDLLSSCPLRSSTKVFGVLCSFDEIATGQQLLVGGVHLTAKPDRAETRAEEITILLGLIKNYREQNTDGPVLIGGDFNDTPNSAVYLRMRLDKFYTTYDHQWTTWKKRDTEVKRVIDYIWYSNNNSEYFGHVVESLSPLPDSTFPNALPDLHFPSDHIPIGVIFQCQPKRLR